MHIVALLLSHFSFGALWAAAASLLVFGTLTQGKFTGFQPNGLWPAADGIRLNRGTPIKAWQCSAVTFSAAAVTAITVSEQAISVAGVTTNDVVILSAQGAPTANVALLGTGRVSVAGTVQGRYVNPTAGSLTPPASQVIFVIAFQVQ